MLNREKTQKSIAFLSWLHSKYDFIKASQEIIIIWSLWWWTLMNCILQVSRYYSCHLALVCPSLWIQQSSTCRDYTPRPRLLYILFSIVVIFFRVRKTETWKRGTVVIYEKNTYCNWSGGFLKVFYLLKTMH